MKHAILIALALVSLVMTVEAQRGVELRLLVPTC